MLENLSPQAVWHYFEQFCGIPHPSGYEQRAAEFIIHCAKELGLPATTDNAGNVLVRKGATNTTYTTTIVLQSHLDMVPQKNEGTEHDFTKDSIKPYIDGEWVKARGTTLGADNGIGVAIALALLQSTTIEHGPIEALFTLDEERGMTGAFGITGDLLTGRVLFNIDTEEEDEICIGCAGGTDIKATIPVHREKTDPAHRSLLLTLKGLQGGHSGMEIHLGRANAIKLMSEFIATLHDIHDMRIADFFGGSARNAIPREVFCTITVPFNLTDLIERRFMAFGAQAARKYHTTDPGMIHLCTLTDDRTTVLSAHSGRTFINALAACPNGVISMNSEVPDAVQTSNNCAIVKCNDNHFRVDCMLRSSDSKELAQLKDAITETFTNSGATVDYGSIYPGWQPKPDSHLLSIMLKAYTTVHRQAPKVVAVHAGLECGIIGSKYPDMDIISCGPTIRYAHSPDEQMHIPSVERFWRCLIAGIEMLH